MLLETKSDEHRRRNKVASKREWTQGGMGTCTVTKMKKRMLKRETHYTKNLITTIICMRLD